MSGITPHEEEREFAGERDSLWRITFSPVIWALHFATSYAGAAIYCAKLADGDGPIPGLRWGIGGLTLVAVAGIIWIGWQSWNQWGYLRTHDARHELGIEEHRHEFLGHAAFLLSVISLIAVVYTALPAVFIGTCA